METIMTRKHLNMLIAKTGNPPYEGSDAPCCGPIQPASRFYSGDLKSDMRLPAIS